MPIPLDARHVPPPDTAPDTTEILSSLAWMVKRATGQPGSFFQALEVCLAVVRRAARAEAIELFLADPKQQFLILTLHEGTHGHAFFERPCFGWGEGFPGIVALQRMPLVTHRLDRDRRYLRSRVKTLGYRSYICIPLELPWGLVGVLNVASRDPDLPEMQILELLRLVGPMLAAGLYTVMTQLAEAQLDRMTSALQRGDTATCHRILLEAAATFSGARLATLRTKMGGQYSSNGEPPPTCSALETCPVWRGEIRSQRLPERQCPHSEAKHLCYCLPLWSSEKVVGVQSIYFDTPPAPPTRFLAPLLWLERLAGSLLQPPQAVGDVRPRNEPAPLLDIETFGLFRVCRDGLPLDPHTIGRNKAWVLLKILVTHWRQPLTFDELSEQLWPGADPKTARNRLQVAVHALRKALEPDPRQPQIILTTEETYRFDPQIPYRLDAEQFEILIDKGNALEGATAVELYRQALELYRGAFMAGEVYSDWCELERSYLRQKAVQALERITAILIERQRLGEAVESCRRLVQLDPWHQGAHAQLIRCLKLLGQEVEARRCFRRYCDVMRQADLPISPRVVVLMAQATEAEA